MNELAEQVNKSSKQLLKASTKVLEKLECSKGCLDNNSQDSTCLCWIQGQDQPILLKTRKGILSEYGHINLSYPAEYLVTTRVAGENLKQSRFNLTWFKEYPHLEYSTSKDAAFCFVCSLFDGGPKAAKADNAWVKEGVRTWHKFKSVGFKTAGKLSKHFSSQAHVMLDEAKRVALIQEDRRSSAK